LSSFEHIIGVSVNATKPDTNTAAATVNANSVNKRPVLPCMNASGVNTTASVIVIATTANAISRLPCSAAFFGAMPSSMWRCMFSSTTIASSTTKPIARTMPSKVRMLMLKPSA